jgi:ribosome-associated heat shock protein Hsp15
VQGSEPRQAPERPPAPGATRVDRWLWAVRLFKTRSTATDACRAGQVSVNGHPAKAATTVRAGDRVEARVGDRMRVVEVVQPIDKRVGPPVAATCLIDHSPPVVREDAEPAPFLRDRGTGRPTKRDRRQLDQLRGP